MNVSRYDRTARGPNAPMYAYYASKIREKTGIVAGNCLDVGCGGGYLGLALAAITDLRFTFLDISVEMLERAKAHIVEDGLQERASTLLADVHEIPLPDETVDLVISRGSIPFWEDPGKALVGIYRLLSPNGNAFVGGGKGTPEMRKRFEAERNKSEKRMHQRRKETHGIPDGPAGRMQARNYHQILRDAGIPRFVVHDGEDGRWIQMWKDTGK